MIRILLFSFLLIPILSISQISLTVNIKNTKGKFLKSANTYISLEGKKTQSKKTNSKGQVFYEVATPGKYTFYYAEDVKGFDFEVKEGRKGRKTRSITYDPKGIFKKHEKSDRSNLTFTDVDQKNVRFEPATGRCCYKIILKSSKGLAIKNTSVDLVDVKSKIRYKSNTGPNGVAKFYLYSAKVYEIDIDGIEGVEVIYVPAGKYSIMTREISYEKPEINQKIVGDSIFQYNISSQQRATTHAYVQIKLINYDKIGLKNEKVCLNDEKSPSVYVGTTNEEGIVKFMLKNGSNYVVHLTYERGVKLIDLENVSGFKYVKKTHKYRGSLLIEQQLAQQKEEMERLKAKLKEAEEAFSSGRAALNVTFNETPVETISEPDKYLLDTPEGFTVNFGNSGKAGTPTIVGDKLYVQQGSYSSNYYCINANNGKFNWGLSLGESGISPAVYKNGVLLINTASCSLYAIDASTGKLLWSKWLAGYVYTTPSADNENVYVAYKHGGYPVVVSFDLRSGKLNWMRLVDEEIIACPIVVDSEIHVASQKGMYYVYDKESGELKKKRQDLNAVSTPTITDKSIYITVAKGASEKLLALDRITLKTIKTYPTSLTSLKISGLRHVDQTDQMNFNGSHPIIYKNKTAILTDKSNIMAFDIESEALLWTHKIQVNSDQLPIVANKKVIITSKTGEVFSFDIQTGKKTLLKKISGKIEGQPIAKQGVLYIAVGGVVKVIRNAVNHSWFQWNKDGGHNAIWE